MVSNADFSDHIHAVNETSLQLLLGTVARAQTEQAGALKHLALSGAVCYFHGRSLFLQKKKKKKKEHWSI